MVKKNGFKTKIQTRDENIFDRVNKRIVCIAKKLSLKAWEKNYSIVLIIRIF